MRAIKSIKRLKFLLAGFVLIGGSRFLFNHPYHLNTQLLHRRRPAPDPSKLIIIDDDIDDANVQGDENIFFVETYDLSYHKFNERQACSIESAATMNPNSQVFLLLLTNTNDTKVVNSTVLQAIQSFKNVHLKYVNLKDFSRDTPMEEFLQSGILENSFFVIEHTSDVLRFLLLWKFAGTYLDLDVIVRKPINVTNFACIGSKPWEVNPAILGLDKKHGKIIAELLMQDQRENFRRFSFNGNGPIVMEKIAKSICEFGPTGMTAECKNFRLLPSDQCYEIRWDESIKLMVAKFAVEVETRTRNSHFVHFWNDLTHNFKLSVNSTAPYVTIAKEFCPRVIRTCEEFF